MLSDWLLSFNPSFSAFAAFLKVFLGSVNRSDIFLPLGARGMQNGVFFSVKIVFGVCIRSTDKQGLS